MPKPVKKATKAPKKPASDPIRRAKQLMDEHTAKVDTADAPWKNAPPLDFETAYRKRMAELGAKGGKIGGAKRRDMPEKKRIAIAKKAAAA